MVYDTDLLIDDNGEFIYLQGRLTKFIYSKMNNNIIGANIISIELIDKFYKTEFKSLIDNLQNEYFNLYKKKIPREQLIIFAPISKNQLLKNYENLKLGFPVKFKISKNFNKAKKTMMYRAAEVEYYTKSLKDDPPKFIKQLPGIYNGKTFIPREELSLGSIDLLNLLDTISKKSSLEEILKFNNHIKLWLKAHIQEMKRREYERECKLIEEKKRREFEESSSALLEALDNIQNVYKDCLSTEYS